MPAGDQVAVPAQHGLRPDQQPEPAQHVAGERVQQRGQQRPVSRSEPDLLAAQLPLQDRDLMAESEDLGVLVPVAHRQQPQQRERVRHAEVRQSQQHSAGIIAQPPSATATCCRTSAGTRSRRERSNWP